MSTGDGATAASGYPDRPGSIIEDQQSDPGFPHLLRMVGAWAAVSLSIYALGAGLFWWAYAFSRSGYRKRDILLLIIPIFGFVVAARVMWRHTARNVYWSRNEDRPSSVLSGWQRPTAIAAGWILFPLLIGAVIVDSLDQGWTTQDRYEVTSLLLDAGFDPLTAGCMTARLQEYMPNPNVGTDAEWRSAFERAERAC